MRFLREGVNLTMNAFALLIENDCRVTSKIVIVSTDGPVAQVLEMAHDIGNFFRCAIRMKGSVNE